MTKRNIIVPIAVMLAVIAIGGALFFILSPARSVWDIAECIGRDDDFYVWIGDSKHHNHFDISTEPPQDVKDILNNLKLSKKTIGNRTFSNRENMIVLETAGIGQNPRVQYFLFNEDFTVVWAADNSWIYENERGSQDDDTYHAEMIFNASEQYNEWSNTERATYRVRNPRAVREFFKNVCEQDTKYD